MDITANAALWTATVLVAVTAWTDWRRREIPHWVTGALVTVWGVAALAARPALGASVAAGLVCGTVGLALGAALYACGWLGGGDAKLLGALALWLGPWEVGFALLGTAVLLAFLVAVARRGGDLRERGIPFACACAPPAAVLLAARAVDLNG